MEVALALCFRRFTSILRISRLLCYVIILLAESNVSGPPHSYEICRAVSHGTKTVVLKGCEPGTLGGQVPKPSTPLTSRARYPLHMSASHVINRPFFCKVQPQWPIANVPRNYFESCLWWLLSAVQNNVTCLIIGNTHRNRLWQFKYWNSDKRLVHPS